MDSLGKPKILPLVYRIVIGNLRHRRARTVLTSLAIGMGVTLLLAVVGISEGMLRDQRERAQGVGADVFVLPSGRGAIGITGTPLSDKYIDFIAQQDHVAMTAGAAVQPLERINRVTGIDWDRFNAMANFQFVAGGPFEEKFDVVIDEFYADQHGLDVGDKVDLLGHEWIVRGIVEPGKMARLLARVDVVQELTNAAGRITMVYVKLDDPERLEEVMKSLETLLGDCCAVLSVEEFVSQFSVDNLPELRIFINVVIGLSVLFGFAVVFLTMHTAVLERTREIGILKSLGASAPYILGIFVREAFVLGLIGTLVGVSASYLSRVVVGVFVRGTMQQAIVYEWWPIALALTLTGSLVGSIYPAWKASRQDALESLSYE